jgi:hypothetical protein
MTVLPESLDMRVRALGEASDPRAASRELLAVGEYVLECWLAARGEVPTTGTHEGFRLLALHRQGARGDPSFNACRETCRELVYRHNLIAADDGGCGHDPARELRLMAAVATHILLFIRGKLHEAALGEFCCSSGATQRSFDLQEA